MEEVLERVAHAPKNWPNKRATVRIRVVNILGSSMEARRFLISAKALTETEIEFWTYHRLPGSNPA